MRDEYESDPFGVILAMVCAVLAVVTALNILGVL